MFDSTTHMKNVMSDSTTHKNVRKTSYNIMSNSTTHVNVGTSYNVMILKMMLFQAHQCGFKSLGFTKILKSFMMKQKGLNMSFCFFQKQF